ncbi:uncharacterized protein LOC113234245 [Hyposmocoma kahamanoa]|uniref:uncharacterized protein LOC113234245 n=1 Tax=Hyposmocoma kahamanoa TaxID=1477025 RepID=UPI000E6D95CA|nr:uncharacterized protein LOC113234245 [Hyposmocoma kahamanoa]
MYELSSTNVGCHIDGVCVNDISYADDMVLLSPSIRGLMSMLQVCESYAVTHGLKYNVTKSQLMICKVDYSRGTYNGLRVQYNNAFRVLLGLSRFCSASGLFAEAHTDGLAAIIRKKYASMLHRLRDSPNRILSALSARWDSPMLAHWVRLHAVV